MLSQAGRAGRRSSRDRVSRQVFASRVSASRSLSLKPRRSRKICCEGPSRTGNRAGRASPQFWQGCFLLFSVLNLFQRVFMLPFRTAAYCLFLLLPLAMAGCRQKMSQKQFDELFATSGDNVPLSPILANCFPHWSNSVSSTVLIYASGKVVNDDMQVTSKTIGGKYIVYSMWSRFYNQEMHSILAYDEKSGVLKAYMPYGDELVESHFVCDVKTRTYSEKSAYGDGFTISTTGFCSDTGDSAHSVVYQHGALFMTRDATNHPVSIPK
jgi:hypothetical protein